MRLAPILLAALLAPAAAATGTIVKVTAKGTVVYNQIKKVPLDMVKGNNKVTMSFLLDSDSYVNGATTPTRAYAIDQSSFSLVFKNSVATTATVTLQSPFPAGQTPYFVLRNNDPGVDGFFIGTDPGGPTGLPINVVGAFGSNIMQHYLATYGGTKLASLDLLGAVGTYDFAGMTVFGFRMEDGPATPMEVDFESMTIETVLPVWTDKGNALAGVAGEPRLAAAGDLKPGSFNVLKLSAANPSTQAALFVGTAAGNMPFKGGTMVPLPTLGPVILTADATGAIQVPFTMPAGMPVGTELWMQWAIPDAAAVRGWALSNALLGVTP